MDLKDCGIICIVMNMNEGYAQKVSELLSVLGNPFRIQILYAVGSGEVCVCHLEALLGEPQPKISQHLSLLRDAGILTTRREGKYVFYRLAEPTLFDLLHAAARMQGIEPDKIPEVSLPEPGADCPCPSCSH